MKKVFILILCIVLAFVPVACTSDNIGSSADTTAADKTAEKTVSSADSTAADKAAVSNNSSEDTTAEDNTAGNNSPDANKAAVDNAQESSGSNLKPVPVPSQQKQTAKASKEQEQRPSKASVAADPRLVPSAREAESSQKSLRRSTVQQKDTEARKKSGERRLVAAPTESPVK